MRVPFAADLASYGDSPAILTDTLAMTYRELAERVDAFALRLGTTRRLVALAAANDLDSLVVYLAALAGGHPLILLPEDKPASLESLVAAYDPDVVVQSGNGQLLLDERRAGTRHELHPDLALLLRTSGSTGSPKLVRLSHGNLQSNAESIAEYLGRRQDVPVRSVSKSEAIDIWGTFATLVVLGASSRSRCPRSRRELGWAPTHSDVAQEILEAPITGLR